MKAGVIARFKPLHNGAATMLKYAAKNYDELVVGIGSANKYDLRNPFTIDQTHQMVDAYLQTLDVSYKIVHIDDFGHRKEFADGKRWKHEILSNFLDVDDFITSNPYVAHLLEDTYTIVHPADLIPKYDWVRLRATQVRLAMAENTNWQQLVPPVIAKYIQENNLDYRFRKEFGDETIQTVNKDKATKMETLQEELENVRS